MQIAFTISTEVIEQMDNTNTAEDYKETAILVSNMLHFLDREFEYQCQQKSDTKCIVLHV